MTARCKWATGGAENRCVDLGNVHQENLLSYFSPYRTIRLLPLAARYLSYPVIFVRVRPGWILYGNVVDFSFIFSLYVSDLVNVTNKYGQEVSHQTHQRYEYKYEYRTSTCKFEVKYLVVRVYSYGYRSVVSLDFPILLFPCTFPLSPMFLKHIRYL